MYSNTSASVIVLASGFDQILLAFLMLSMDGCLDQMLHPSSTEKEGSDLLNFKYDTNVISEGAEADPSKNPQVSLRINLNQSDSGANFAWLFIFASAILKLASHRQIEAKAAVTTASKMQNRFIASEPLIRLPIQSHLTALARPAVSRTRELRKWGEKRMLIK